MIRQLSSEFKRECAELVINYGYAYLANLTGDFQLPFGSEYPFNDIEYDVELPS